MSEDERLARLFHEAYERLAPSFGYMTRKESAVQWEKVPSANRNLMIAVVAEVISPALSAERTARRVLREAVETLLANDAIVCVCPPRDLEIGGRGHAADCDTTLARAALRATTSDSTYAADISDAAFEAAYGTTHARAALAAESGEGPAAGDGLLRALLGEAVRWLPAYKDDLRDRISVALGLPPEGHPRAAEVKNEGVALELWRALRDRPSGTDAVGMLILALARAHAEGLEAAARVADEYSGAKAQAIANRIRSLIPAAPEEGSK